MRSEAHITGHRVGYRIALVTLDAHAAGPCARASEALASDFPGLSIEVHAAAEWGENKVALDAAQKAILEADIIVVNLLFLKNTYRPFLHNCLRGARPVMP